MSYLNIKLNYHMRLSIKAAASAVDAYINIPPFSLWDLVNFSKSREDKKKKERFRTALTQLTGFLQDVAGWEPLDAQTPITYDELCLSVDISDTDEDMLNSLEYIKCALKGRVSISGIESRVVHQIEQYYLFLWHQALVARRALNALPEGGYGNRAEEKTPIDCFARELSLALQDAVVQRVPRVVRQTSMCAFVERDAYQVPHRYSVRGPSTRTMPTRAMQSTQDAPVTFFGHIAGNAQIEGNMSATHSSRKRDRTMRDGVTIEISRSEHTKKRLKSEHADAWAAEENTLTLP
ncbi:MAG: hypothetical protein P1U32_02175 [Legionellaceae bacterium]|nr:hypothetical protein [Legionellaceae bacterium]